MNFSELLKKWNGGMWRGAKRNFAKAVGLHEVTIGQYVNGKKIPGEESRAQIAKELGISVGKLLESFPSRDEVREPGGRYAPADICGSVSASGIVELDPDDQPRGKTPFAVEHPPGKVVKTVVLNGDCMLPLGGHGDFAVVYMGEKAKEGDIVIARADGEVLIKQIYYDGKRIELRPRNPKFKSRFFHATKVEVLAVVDNFVRVTKVRGR